MFLLLLHGMVCIFDIGSGSQSQQGQLQPPSTSGQESIVSTQASTKTNGISGLVIVLI